MLSLCELTRAVELVRTRWVDARVDKVVQPDARSVVLSLHHPDAGNGHLLLSTELRLARLSMLARKAAAPPTPPRFAQLLRARLAGARLRRAELVDGDRLAALGFESREGRFELRLALMGPRSNLYLLDGDGRVLDALRPLAETRRDLAVGQPWRRPESGPPPAGEDRFADAPDEGFFAAVEAHYGAQASGDAGDALRRRLEKALRKGAQTLARKRDALERDAASGDEVDSLRRRGELLKSALPGLRPGAREARARDFETGEEVVIALDPARTPQANLDDCFRRARKAEKRAARAARELGELEARERDAETLRGDYERIAREDTAALKGFAARPEVARLLGRYAAEPAPSRGAGPAKPARPPAAFRLGNEPLPRRLWPRRYRSSDALEIWVGRSDEGNDVLSTRLARGNDLFFHLDASPGTHVVLRTGGRSDPPSESLLEACELAVHFSKQRKVTRAHVLVTPIKNVRKPRGAKPGLVAVSGGRRIDLRRDPRRLERVLAARVEDGD